MKKIVLAFWCCLLGVITVKAQVSLGIDTLGYSYPATTTANSSDFYKVYVRNFSTQPYTGNIYVDYWVDSTGSNNMLALRYIGEDSVVNTTLPANGLAPDSTNIIIRDSMQGGGNYHFRQGINTVVIWPRSAGTSYITHDSLKLPVMVMGYNGINTPTVKVSPKIFPNPAHQELFISNTDPNFVIEQVRLFSAEGKLISQQPFSGKLELGALSAGVYFVEFSGKNGKTSRYKLIKE
jgi:hypothetical protein